ncbi:MAG: ABC-three component system protein, partial [Candidatus Dormibacteria bacterium]
MVDPDRAWWSMRFDWQFSRIEGEAFQAFFCDLMGRAYPGDFIPTRPWGRQGDRKNDGYLKSQRQLFQAYAPSRYVGSTLTSKMEEDWAGAIAHWKEFFSEWTFVHNDVKGLGPAVVEKLLEFDARIPDVTCSAWGHAEVRQVVMSLTAEHLTDLLGPAISLNSRVSLPQVQALLAHLRTANPVGVTEVRPVPPDKVALNGLSASTEALLTAGMRWSPEIDKYFQGQVLAPGTRDATATYFRGRYDALRGEGWNGDQLFAQLCGELLGASHDSQGQTSSLAVIAYIFESCD